VIPYSKNLILNSLPKTELELLLPHLQHCPVLAHQVLVESEAKIQDVYFPVSCMISLVTLLDDGGTIESATIGNEGMSGLSIFYGLEVSSYRAVVQMEGEAYKVPATTFREILARAPLLGQAIGRYADALISILAQSGACNGLHSVEQRLARWILTVSDRVGGEEYAITQDFLSQMLGSFRPTVTLAAGILQRAGLISYHHGHLRILDRSGLEDVACECYAIVRALYSRTYNNNH
jgi:CRP-like cAMP-binding protein